MVVKFNLPLTATEGQQEALPDGTVVEKLGAIWSRRGAGGLQCIGKIDEVRITKGIVGTQQPTRWTRTRSQPTKSTNTWQTNSTYRSHQSLDNNGLCLMVVMLFVQVPFGCPSILQTQ